MKIIIFEFLALIKYFLFIISILGILVQAHRKNLVQATVQCTVYTVHCKLGWPNKKKQFCDGLELKGEVIIK